MGHERSVARGHRAIPQHAVPVSAGRAGARVSDAARGAVTLALAGYFLALLLSVAANSTSGASALVSTLHERLASPWLVPPWLDLGFDYALTRGLPDDADHRLAAGSHGAADTPLAWPDSGARGERARRWRRLARAVMLDDADPAGSSVLATGMAEGLFNRLGAEDVDLTVFRSPLPERGSTVVPLPEKAVALRLRRAPAGLQLIRDAEPEELAPLLRPAVPREGTER